MVVPMGIGSRRRENGDEEYNSSHKFGSMSPGHLVPLQPSCLWIVSASAFELLRNAIDST